MIKRFGKKIFAAALALALVAGSVSVPTMQTHAESLRYSVTGQLKNMSFSETPVGKHGTLSVKKVSQYKAPTIVDQYGNPVLLRGASTHGVQWFPQYVNEAAFQSMRDEWGINLVRLALYAKEGGYTQGSQSIMDQKIKEGVDAAKKLGMYIILDWHVLSYNPNESLNDAKQFFARYAKEYANCPNVIFEIANEPTGTPWYNGSNNDLYSYSKQVCKVIRDAGAKNIIICGTNDWSQRVDEVATKPLAKDGFENIMYALHFYAATHYDGIKGNLQKAVNDGTPLFVTEFGTCDASGNGGYDFNNANAWMKLLGDNNISYANWSLCNKGEAASMISSSCNKTSKWTGNDLTESGKWLVNVSRDFAAKEGNVTPQPTQPQPTEPQPTQPQPTEPQPTQPQPTEPQPTQPQPTQPQPTEPQPTQPVQPSTGKVTASASIQSEWNTGLTANVVIKNDSNAAVNGWTLEFDCTAKITNIWCAKIVSHSGKHYVIAPESYNSTVGANQNVSFGFNAEKTSGSAKITNVKVK